MRTRKGFPARNMQEISVRIALSALTERRSVDKMKVDKGRPFSRAVRQAEEISPEKQWSFVTDRFPRRIRGQGAHENRRLEHDYI